MKKSYKKIFIFQITVFILLFLNSFVSNILGGYSFILFLLVSLGVFKILFGFEKDKHRYAKDITYEIIIFLLVYFILSYLLGLAIGFVRNNNYYNWYGIIKFILPTVLIIILKEIFRYMMLKKVEKSKLLLITTVVLFIFLDVTSVIYYSQFNSNYNVFKFIALSLIPAVSSNIVFTYLSQKVGYKSIICYLLITKLQMYLVPIVPDFNEYLTSIIGLLLPIVLWYIVYKSFEKVSKKEKTIVKSFKKKNLVLVILFLVLISIIIYFTSGYFRYYALAIASGSMEQTIKKGDIVIVEKLNDNYSSLKKGDIIVYRYNEIVVVHRIVNIVKDRQEYYFYTKGDANNNKDNYVVSENMIIGTVIKKIPYIGIPTVWLNEL